MIIWIFHIVATLGLLAYGGASWCYIHATLTANSALRPRASLFLRIGLAAHLLWLLYIAAVGLPMGPSAPTDFNDPLLGVILSGPGVASVISLVVLCIFMFTERFSQIGMLGSLIVPISATLFLIGALSFHVDKGEIVSLPYSVKVDAMGIFTLHIACIILSIANYIFSFCVSVALIVQDRLVRRGNIVGLVRRLPPIARLDALNISFLTAGFIFLVFGLGLGFWQAFYYGMKELGRTSKLYASIGAFLIYFLIIVANLRWNVRGRRLAWLSISGFVVLLLTLWLSILSRMSQIGINSGVVS